MVAGTVVGEAVMVGGIAVGEAVKVGNNLVGVGEAVTVGNTLVGEAVTVGDTIGEDARAGMGEVFKLAYWFDAYSADPIPVFQALVAAVEL